jgi:hypothetical protein
MRPVATINGNVAVLLSTVVMQLVIIASIANSKPVGNLAEQSVKR